MLEFEKLIAKQNTSITDGYGENIVRGGDFDGHGLKASKKWGTMAETADGAWVAETGRIEVQKATGHKGTPAKKVKSTVLELDSATGRKGLGATDSNSVVSQEIDGITGPGTYRLSLDYKGMKKGKASIAETGTAEVWIGDKLVSVLVQEKRGWEERIVEFTLEEGDIPPGGVVDLRLVSTGKADGRGAQVDNISLREIGETGLLGDELVTNGDFEDSGGRGFYESIPGWTVNAESVIELKSVRKPVTPRDKSDAYVELDSHGKDSNSVVVQEIDVPEDGTYLLSFDYSPRAGRGKNAESTSPIKVMVGDEVVAEISAAEVGWEPYTFNVDLAKGPVKLSFEGAGEQDTIGGLLDKVALRKVGDLDVEPDNLGPDAIDDTAQGLEDEAITIDALGNDTDPDGDTVFIVDATDGANGSVAFTPPNVEEEASEDVTLGENLIVNGDFEDNPLNGRIGWGHYDSIEGWDSPVGRVEVQTRDYNTGNTRGNAVVELDSHGRGSNATLLQEVEIAEAGTYQFEMDYAMRGKHAWTNGVGVRINGETLHEVIKPSEKGFQSLVLDLELDPGTASIEIYALGKQDTIGTVIDNISLRHVQPGEPVRVISAPDGGVITYTPEPGFVGEDTFTYTVSDGNGGTDTATVTVVVEASNHAPVAADDQVSTDEDTAIVLDLLDNDQDPDGDALTITELGEVENGTLELNADGTVTFTPDADFHGTVSFDYTISDGEFTSTATATVVVTPVNDAVVAEDDVAGTDEDTSITLDLLANDSDVDGDALTITELGEVENGTLELNEDGTVTFTPDADFHGTISFDYTVSDGETTATATATVVVASVNDPVVARDDDVSSVEDSSVTFDLLANDSDVDGDALTITELGEVENGTLELNEDGTVTFTPGADFHGTISFDYTVSDGETTSTATATVQIVAVNDPVVAEDDAFSTSEDAPIVMNLLSNDSDVDGDALTITELGEVANGTLKLNDDGTVTFTPDANFSGTVAFDYTVSDGTVTATATATIDVTPVNDPVIARDDDARMDEDSSVIIDLLGNDSDADGDALTITELGEVENGTLELNADGTVTFTPDADFHGTVSFDYTVSDGETSATARANVVVDGVNDGPVAVADHAETENVEPVIIDVLANDLDIDGDTLSVQSVGGSDDGTVELLDDGTISFTAHQDFFGTASFSYTISDGAETDTVEVSVLVLQPNRAPEPVDDFVTIDEDTSVTLDFLANDLDPDGDALTFVEFGDVPNGTLEMNADGTVTFTPDADYEGDVRIRYTVADDEGLTGNAMLRITVENVNDAPEPVADFAEVSRDDTLVVDVLANDSDPDARDVLELVSASTSRGSVSIVDGEILFDPLDDFADMEVETTTEQVVFYTVRDSEGVERTSTLTLTVSAPRQDSVNETLNFRDSGARGTQADLDGQAGDLSIDGVGVEGFDNDDRLGIDLDARGGHGRSSARTTRGESSDTGDGGAGEDAEGFGGFGGDASSELSDAFLTGNEFEDRLKVVVEASGGNGGRGYAGGDGGDANPLGQHRDVASDGSERVSDYGTGPAFTGGNGGDGADGSDGGAAHAAVLGGVFDGGVDNDNIEVEVFAKGGDGGNGGNGGEAGNGGNDRPVGGDHANTSSSGHGGLGGNGGDALAELAEAELLGGDGNDALTLTAKAVAGEGGSGGDGGDAGQGLFLDTTKTDNGLFIDPTFEGELFALFGTAGDGGDAGDNGAAEVIVADNLMSGGAGADELAVRVTVSSRDPISGSLAGAHGIDGTLSPEESGDYTRHETAGIAGRDGDGGGAGSVRIDITGNTLDGGLGDDRFVIALDVHSQGNIEVTVEGNEILGGDGLDFVDFSKIGMALELDLGAGHFAFGDGGANAVSGIEHVLATEFDDVITGTSQDETVTGDAGDDVLSGGGGRDLFIFDDGHGADSIEDFSNDVLDVAAHSTVQGFDTLAISDTAAGALITMLSGDSILLRGVSADQIGEENFIF